MRFIRTLVMLTILLGGWHIIGKSISISAQSVGIGQPAPDINLPDVNGQYVSLSSLKDQFVYLNFWASWCPSCVLQFDNASLIYDKYHDRRFRDATNFDIFTVSLDGDKYEWGGAIQQYKMERFINTCDFKGFGSPAVRAFGLSAIPASFLIDPRGVVISKNPSFSDLDLTLHKGLLPQDMYYKIELGIFTTLAFHDFRHISEFGELEVQSTTDGRQKVLLGSFYEMRSAEQTLEAVRVRGYRDAYLVLFKNNRRMEYTWSNSPQDATDINISGPVTVFNTATIPSYGTQSFYGPRSTGGSGGPTLTQAEALLNGNPVANNIASATEATIYEVPNALGPIYSLPSATNSYDGNIIRQPSPIEKSGGLLGANPSNNNQNNNYYSPPPVEPAIGISESYTLNSPPPNLARLPSQQNSPNLPNGDYNDGYMQPNPPVATRPSAINSYRPKVTQSTPPSTFSDNTYYPEVTQPAPLAPPPTTSPSTFNKDDWSAERMYAPSNNNQTVNSQPKPNPQPTYTPPTSSYNKTPQNIPQSTTKPKTFQNQPANNYQPPNTTQYGQSPPKSKPVKPTTPRITNNASSPNKTPELPPAFNNIVTFNQKEGYDKPNKTWSKSVQGSTPKTQPKAHTSYSYAPPNQNKQDTKLPPKTSYDKNNPYADTYVPGIGDPKSDGNTNQSNVSVPTSPETTTSKTEPKTTSPEQVGYQTGPKYEFPSNYPSNQPTNVESTNGTVITDPLSAAKPSYNLGGVERGTKMSRRLRKQKRKMRKRREKLEKKIREMREREQLLNDVIQFNENGRN